jgi:hypothetical protein
VSILDRDLFELWRLLLGVLCGTYAAVVTARSLWGWVVYLSVPGRQTTVMRNYVLVLLLRLRPGRFAGELLQIFGLSVILFVLLRYHA